MDKELNLNTCVSLRLGKSEASMLRAIANQPVFKGNQSKAVRFLIREAFSTLAGRPDKLDEVHSMVTQLVHLITQQRADPISRAVKPVKSYDPRPVNEHLR